MVLAINNTIINLLLDKEFYVYLAIDHDGQPYINTNHIKYTVDSFGKNDKDYKYLFKITKDIIVLIKQGFFEKKEFLDLTEIRVALIEKYKAKIEKDIQKEKEAQIKIEKAIHGLSFSNNLEGSLSFTHGLDGALSID